MGERGESTRPQESSSAQLAALAKRVTALYREGRGRGPDSIRARHTGSVVVVVMRDDFTPFERTLVEAGRGDAVVEHRIVYSQASSKRLIEIVEEELGVEVEVHMSAANPSPEVAVELFLLQTARG